MNECKPLVGGGEVLSDGVDRVRRVSIHHGPQRLGSFLLAVRVLRPVPSAHAAPARGRDYLSKRLTQYKVYALRIILKYPRFFDLVSMSFIVWY